MDAYAPWRIDSELPYESAYSLFSKAAWWKSATPSSLLASYVGEGRPTYGRRSRMVMFGMPEIWIRSLHGSSCLPATTQGTLLDSLVKAEADQRVGIADLWQSPVLRFCQECVSLGVHLWIHQHTLIVNCPVHLIPLASACARCGQPIQISYRVSQAPFTCLCGHSLIGSAGCAAVAEREDFGRLPGIAEEMSDWLSLAAAQASTVELPGAWQAQHFAEVCAISLQRLPVPACMRRDIDPRFDVRLKSVGVCDGSLKNVTAGDFELESCQWSTLGRWERSEGLAPDVSPSLVGAVASAFRRVAIVHLATTSKHACIDLPWLMFRESLLLLQADSMSELVQCCPVGVGFWIWRMLCDDLLSMIRRNPQSAWQSELLKSQVGGNSALYVLARSELHYCIRACEEVFQRHQAGEMDLGEVRQALLGLRDLSGSWGAAGGFRLRPLEVNGRWVYTSIDATELVSGVCADGETCAPRLKRFLSSRYDESVAARYAESLADSASKRRCGTPGLSELAMVGCERRVLLPGEDGASSIGQVGRNDPLKRAGIQWLDLVISLRGGCSSRRFPDGT